MSAILKIMACARRCTSIEARGSGTLLTRAGFNDVSKNSVTHWSRVTGLSHVPSTWRRKYRHFIGQSVNSFSPPRAPTARCVISQWTYRDNSKIERNPDSLSVCGAPRRIKYPHAAWTAIVPTWSRDVRVSCPKTTIPLDLKNSKLKSSWESSLFFRHLVELLIYFSDLRRIFDTSWKLRFVFLSTFTKYIIKYIYYKNVNIIDHLPWSKVIHFLHFFYF